MTPPQPGDPCVAPMVHLPVPGLDRVRVVQVMATGTNGGAQEHVYNLVSRLDPVFYDVSVVSLSNGSAVRRLQRAGVDVTVIDTPDDVIATATLATYLTDVRADIVHNHMYRAEIVGTKAAIALGEAGHRRPWVLSTVHSSRVRSVEDQEQVRLLTPQMNHVIAVSRAIEAKIAGEGREGAPSAGSTTALTSSATTTRSRAARCAASTAWTTTPRSWASSAGSSSRRATPRCSRRGRSCSTRSRAPTC